MASQQKAPTLASGTNWTTPGNVFADDGNRASYNGSGQDDLRITGFGFSLPLNATVTGIVVHTQGQGASATATDRQVRIGLTKNGVTLAGTRKTGIQYAQNADTDVNSGTSTDLWGTTWTPAEINAATFGVLLSDNDAIAAQLAIDVVDVTVYYALPGFPVTPKPETPYGETAQFRTEISIFEGKMEQRRRKWATPRRKFTLKWNVLTAAEVDTLWNFYLARAGAFEAFTFTNLNDGQEYIVRFVEDNMTKERFAAALFSTGLELIETNA